MEKLEINTMADVRSFFYYLMVEMELGAGFHPDTPIDDYTNADGSSYWGGHPQPTLQKQLDRCFEVVEDADGDIYECGMELGRKLGYYPRPDDEKQSVTLLFGQDAISEFEDMDANINLDERLEAATAESGMCNTFSFDTKQEMDAFMQGIDAMDGWMNVLQID